MRYAVPLQEYVSHNCGIGMYSIREDTKFERDISYASLRESVSMMFQLFIVPTYSAAKTYLHVYYAVCAVCEGNEVIARKQLRQRRKY